jgi:hypothetical protein
MMPSMYHGKDIFKRHYAPPLRITSKFRTPELTGVSRNLGMLPFEILKGLGGYILFPGDAYTVFLHRCITTYEAATCCEL